jgi:uncharacterized protein YjbI with pentapeptide repeats
MQDDTQPEITQEAARYNIEVLRSGAWVPTDDRSIGYSEARDAMRSWNALGCSARMVAAGWARVVSAQHFQIKHRLTGAVLFEGRFDTMPLCVEAARKSGANLLRANLSGATLSGADLSGATLSGADLSGANLLRANLSGANLSGADLSGANLLRANLSGATLSGADLSGADLSGADLSRANLSWADLSRADLSRANLSGADLSGANLLRADLSRANLLRANLSGANLSGADLSGANLSGATLSGAVWRKGFTLNRPPVRVAQRRDGHTFYLIDTSQGWRVAAGCRFFTYEEAWAHWCGFDAARRGTPLGDETQDILVMFSLALDREGA